MRDRQDIERLEDILDMIAKLASLDFSTELPVSGKQDMIDAISLGLNMLGEELNVQVVARARLDELNEKLEKFAYTTAHDLKSPLNSQAGLLNVLEHTIDFKKNGNQLIGTTTIYSSDFGITIIKKSKEANAVKVTMTFKVNKE